MLDDLTGLFGVPAGASAVIYTRVSKDSQIKGYSLAAQQARSEQLAASKGWVVIAHYSDEGKSGQTTDRPAFKQMLADAEAGKFKVIIVHKLDRLTRSLPDLLLMMDSFNEIDVRVISATELYDFTSPIGKLMLAFLGALAQWYLDNLSQEIKKGLKARARAGGWSGGLAYGYTSDYKKDGGDSLAVIDENAADIVREIFQTYALGTVSLRDIAVSMNERRLRTSRGNMWSKVTVRKIILNRFYLGHVRCEGEWIEGLHEAIISQEAFDTCQTVIQQRRNRTKYSQKKGDRVYLLAGICFCNKCGSRYIISPEKKKRDSQLRAYLVCANRKKRKACEQPYVRTDAIEPEVVRLLKAITLPEDWQEQIRENIKVYLEDEDDNEDDRKKQHSRLEGQLERWKKLFLFGDVSEKEYRAESARIKANLALLEADSKVIRGPEGVSLNDLAQIIQNLEILWETATPKERREIAHALIKRIELGKEEGITKIVWADGLGLFVGERK